MADGTAPRPPRYDDAVDMYQGGLDALADGHRAPELGQRRQEAYLKAAALFAGAQAAAAIRLIAPVRPYGVTLAGGVTDTGHTVQ